MDPLKKKRKVEEIVINDSNSPLSSQSSQSKKRRRNEDENLIIPSMIPSYSQSPIRKKLIVYSGCTIEEYDAMKEILKSMPNCELLEKGFELKNNSHVTHIVVGKNQKRTMNVMLGILMHKILVTVDWVHKCVEKKNWVDESDFLPEKYNKSTTHGPKLFSGLKFVLDQTEKNGVKELKQLIEVGGGTILGSSSGNEKFDFFISENTINPKKYNAKLIKPTQLYDIIQNNSVGK